MREIRFRGKRIDTGKWVYGYVDSTMKKDIVAINTSIGTFVVDQDTVGQFTGLRDKKGKKIYEGDIIDFTNVDYPNCEIIFDNGSFVCNEIGEDNIIYELRISPVNEVIGNIHDLNLLEKEEFDK